MISTYFVAYEELKIPYRYGNKNEKGIPLFDPSAIKQSGEISYHPISLVQYGLAHFNLYSKGKGDYHRTEFLRIASFLKDSYAENIFTGQATWFYNFPLDFPETESPWYSGMCQGQILSVFSRAFLLTKLESYRITSEKALIAFANEIDNGGCVTIENGEYFIQELAFFPVTSILNGAMYAMVGILDYYIVFSDKSLFPQELLEGLISKLPDFDTGYWSRYSANIRFNLADSHYHDIHIKQLQYLGEHLNCEELIFYASKFENYKKRNALMRILRLLSLNTNRVIRLLGLSKLLFK